MGQNSKTWDLKQKVSLLGAMLHVDIKVWLEELRRKRKKTELLWPSEVHERQLPGPPQRCPNSKLWHPLIVAATVVVQRLVVLRQGKIAFWMQAPRVFVLLFFAGF